jgi:hypothetical protein
MGLPAVKHDVPSASRARRPRLRVVTSQARPQARTSSAKASNSPRTASRAAAHQGFVFFAVVVAVVAVLGLGRVWLSVQAAQASIDSARLRKEIKAERYAGDMLEYEKSALATPSRIQTIVGATMSMAPEGPVTYLDLQAEGSGSAVAAAPAETRDGSGSRVLERAMDVAAGEARLLLVGDVGLASTR